VCAVGDLTCAGKANRALDIENELTPLQKKLETIAE
jgi:Ca2+ transporting ATPase